MTRAVVFRSRRPPTQVSRPPFGLAQRGELLDRFPGVAHVEDDAAEVGSPEVVDEVRELPAGHGDRVPGLDALKVGVFLCPVSDHDQ